MSDLPLVSVIMPVRNEASFIERSLSAVMRQDYPPECLEIVFIDGLSNDGTVALVSQYLSEVKANTPVTPSVYLLDNPKQHMPGAFNLGVQKASGDIIIVIGGHCVIEPDYVRQCVGALEATGADCVGGPMVTVGETTMAKGIALAQSSRFGVGGVAFRTGRREGCYVDTVAFGAYRREVFERIGLFDEELVRNQDDEFNFRLTQAGGKIWLDPAIRSVYYSRASLSRLWRQYYQYGLYKVRVIQKRQAVPSWRHLVPAVFVLALLMSLVFSLLTGQRRWLLAVAGPYTLANGFASLRTAGADTAILSFLPLAFATLHFAYGLGFLAGLWHWRNHWGQQS
ncbi:MAG: glycosyltransferase family 2 protein [Chitinophagaceae bacterium]